MDGTGFAALCDDDGEGLTPLAIREAPSPTPPPLRRERGYVLSAPLPLASGEYNLLSEAPP